MEIKTTRRYHFISRRMAIIKKTDNTQVLARTLKTGDLIVAGVEYKMVQTHWKTV